MLTTMVIQNTGDSDNPNPEYITDNFFKGQINNLFNLTENIYA